MHPSSFHTAFVVFLSSYPCKIKGTEEREGDSLGNFIKRIKVLAFFLFPLLPKPLSQEEQKTRMKQKPESSGK